MSTYRTKQLVLGCAIIALVATVAGLTVLWSTQQVLSATEEITQSDKVLTELDEFPFRLANAAKAYHDFIFTGEEPTLALYETATASVQQRLGELQTLVANSPEQKQRIESLRALVQERLQHLQQIVQIRRDEGGEAALTAIAADESGGDSWHRCGGSWKKSKARSGSPSRLRQRQPMPLLNVCIAWLLKERCCYRYV